MLGRIFSHRRGRRTVVAAPLVRMDQDEPDTTDEPAPADDDARPEPAPEPAPPEVEPEVEPLVATEVAEPVAPEAPVAPEPQVAPEVPVQPEAPIVREVPVVPDVPVEAARTRLCRTCGGRVPVGADGRRCHRGHRLSPAHGERPRGGWLRRLFGRG